MKIIRNDAQFVEETTQTGLIKLGNIQLTRVTEVAAEGASVERDCSQTHEKGVEITQTIKQALDNTYTCMKETSIFHQDTDHSAEKSIQEATTWSMKLGGK